MTAKKPVKNCAARVYFLVSVVIVVALSSASSVTT